MTRGKGEAVIQYYVKKNCSKMVEAQGVKIGTVDN